MSRRRMPKQVLKLFGEQSLLQLTVRSLTPLVDSTRVLVITSQSARPLAIRQLPEVPRRNIIAEPVGRNTGPAVGLAAHLVNQMDEEAMIGVFPADHHFGNTPELQRAIQAAFDAILVDEGFVALAVPPLSAESAYGYLELLGKPDRSTLTPVPVRGFHEKPDTATAAEYLRSGNYWWEIGTFFGRPRTFLRELEGSLPATASVLACIPGLADRSFNRKLRVLFPQCENISIDHAVMEKASRLRAISVARAGWSDTGNWNVVYAALEKDKSGNVLPGESIFENCAGNFIRSEKFIALINIHDLVVIETPDVLLISDRASATHVKELVAALDTPRYRKLL